MQNKYFNKINEDNKVIIANYISLCKTSKNLKKVKRNFAILS